MTTGEQGPVRVPDMNIEIGTEAAVFIERIGKQIGAEFSELLRRYRQGTASVEELQETMKEKIDSAVVTLNAMPGNK